MVIFRKHLTLSLVLCAGFVALLGSCGKDGPNAPEGPDPDPVVDTTPPAAIMNMVTRNPAPEAISIRWQAPGDDGNVGVAASYDARYHTEEITEDNWDAAVQIDNEPTPGQPGLFQAVRILGLDPSTDYRFAIKTSDEAGNVSELSNSPSGTTSPEAVPPDPVVDLLAIAVDATTFRLTWTSTGDDGSTGQARETEIRFQASAFGEVNWDLATPAVFTHTPKMAGELDTLILTGFTPEANYKFAMKVADEVPNWSDVSNDTHELAFDTHLAVSSSTYESGEVMVIRFRSDGVTDLYLRLQAGWNPQDCFEPTWGYVQKLRRGSFPAGTHTYVWDFYDEESDTYYPISGSVVLCYGLELMGSRYFYFSSP